MIIKLLEILRIAGASVGVFLAYYFGKSPEEVLCIMTPWFIGSVAGLSAIEGLFFSKKAAEEKGFEQGSNYQRQNAFWFLAIAVIALVVFFAGWDVYANISLVFVFSLFLILSAANHTWSMYAENNMKWQNVIRPVLTALLTMAFWFPVSSILFK
uniref:Integral membrane protein n=1 Tax=Chlorobium phaeobacteroides (strain BS1) TaxID=331678 RepID=B3EJ85_CHLPB